jgi:electron transport complex protein RnfD
MTDRNEKITLGLILRRWVKPDASRPADMPHLASGKDVQRYSLAAVAAGALCLAAAVYYFGFHVLAMAATALAAATLVELWFRFEVTFSPNGLNFKQTGRFVGGQMAYAILFALVLPVIKPAMDGNPAEPFSLGLVFLASVLGVLFAQEVFGGAGRNVFSVVMVSKGLLLFSYLWIDTSASFGSMMQFNTDTQSWNILTNTDTAFLANGMILSDAPWVVCSVLMGIGAIFMVVARLSNAVVILSCGAAMLVSASIAASSGSLPAEFLYENQMLLFSGMALGMCLLICDPGTVPATVIGKVIYGGVIGSCAILMRCLSSYNESMVAAVLMGNLVAPLLDNIFVKTPKEEPAPIRPVCADCAEA